MLPTYPAIRSWAADARDDPLLPTPARYNAATLCRALDMLDTTVASNARCSMHTTILLMLEHILTARESCHNPAVHA